MTNPKKGTEKLTLPDFGNFGVMLRILLGVNFLAFGIALARGDSFRDGISQYIALSTRLEPLLLLDILALALVNDGLSRLPARVAQVGIVIFVASSAVLLQKSLIFIGLEDTQTSLYRTLLFASAAAGALLYYFELRAQAFSPALTEARLQALTARIRPHFLFNSLNAVISLIRAEPRRAEQALEDLADLFRVMMRDHGELLPLADELALCRQYLELEKLRLGERLTVVWEIPEIFPNINVPQLMIQPLLENAVYYGIEPLSEGGTVAIRLTCWNNRIYIDLSNPFLSAQTINASPMGRREGHHMAIANIRERLSLHYDLEARLETKENFQTEDQGEYLVHIVLPCRSIMK